MRPTKNLNTCFYIILFVLFLSFTDLRAQQKESDGRELKVLTFNILHGATTRGDFDLDVIAKVIIDSEADLVALQEVDYNTGRSGKLDLASELGFRAHLTSIFGRAMYYDGGEYGEAVLSRYTLLSSRNIALPHEVGSEPRAALEITTILDSGDTICFIGTHLDHLKSDADRLMQVERINSVFLKNTFPTILAGDLNALPQSAVIQNLLQYWTPTDSDEKPAFTFPSNLPQKKIDYILFYPKDRWQVISTEVIADPIASDHAAYLVTIELLPGS